MVADEDAMRFKLLITDLDDTLYSWVNYWSPCFRAMVHALSHRLKVGEDVLIEDFRNVYSVHKSLEYVHVVQELDICKNLSEREKDELVVLAHTVFGQIARKNLRPYKNVKETLGRVYRSGIQIVGLTNAPLSTAMGRLWNLGLSKFFIGLAALESHEVPRFTTSNEILKHSLFNKVDRIHRSTYKTWSFSEREIKPSKVCYSTIIEELRVAPNEACVIGDSLTKDISPAHELGLTTIHAHFEDDLNVMSKNLDTLLRVTHWSKERIRETRQQETAKPDFVVTSFEQLAEILGLPRVIDEPTQPTLFPDSLVSETKGTGSL